MNNRRLAAFFRSRFFLGILIGVVGMLLVFCIFEAGVAVGFHEAEFSYHWGENYGQNFGASSDSLGLPSAHMPTPEGNVGEIASVATNGGATTLVISSNQKPEEKVLIANDTVIRERDMTLQPSDLTVGMTVVVIGSPDTQGEIDAKLIRVFTVPLDASSSARVLPNSPVTP